MPSSFLEWWQWAFGDREFFCFWWLRGLLFACLAAFFWRIGDPTVGRRKLIALIVFGAFAGALAWLLRGPTPY